MFDNETNISTFLILTCGWRQKTGKSLQIIPIKKSALMGYHQCRFFLECERII